MEADGASGSIVKLQVQALVARLVMATALHRRQQHVQIEGRRSHGHGAGIDLGDVQEVADHFQQGLAGTGHRTYHVLLLETQGLRAADPPCR